MVVQSTLRELSFADALRELDSGAAFVDLRPIDAYLEVHVPGSLALLYEFGPGLPVRARDCIPLDLPFVILDSDAEDAAHAARGLRGKGFTVLGKTDDAVNNWAASGGRPASTEVITESRAPDGLILDVADPGARVPATATRIPAELLWDRVDEVKGQTRVIVAAGYGVRAALCIGIMERAGINEILFWRTTSRPRVGGS